MEEAWRIVDPVLKAAPPVQEYQKDTWGPAQVDKTVLPPGGWHNPAGGGSGGLPRCQSGRLIAEIRG